VSATDQTDRLLARLRSDAAIAQRLAGCSKFLQAHLVQMTEHPLELNVILCLLTRMVMQRCLHLGIEAKDYRQLVDEANAMATEIVKMVDVHATTQSRIARA
jgi:hypothetical protein